MFGRALISLSLSLSQLSVWLEHGSGSSYRGCFWSLVTTILQMLLALAISLYSVLGQEYDWAARASLAVMVTVQVLMAVWSVFGDPIDRLEGLVSALVSMLEASATSILLASNLLQDVADDATLGLLGGLSTALLMASVFTPIVLSAYDNVLLPTYDAMKARMESGESCGKAACGIVSQLVLLPISIASAAFGVSFKAGDVVQAAVDDAAGTVQDGKLAAQETRARGANRDGAGARTHLETAEGVHEHKEEADVASTSDESTVQPVAATAAASDAAILERKIKTTITQMTFTTTETVYEPGEDTTAPPLPPGQRPPGPPVVGVPVQDGADANGSFAGQRASPAGRRSSPLSRQSSPAFLRQPTTPTVPVAGMSPTMVNLWGVFSPGSNDTADKDEPTLDA